MTTKRIVLLSVVSLIVLAIAYAGTAIYVHFNTGPKLLARITLALRAGKLDKALNLAETYARKYPDKWHGYYYQAQAHILRGEYARARPLLEKAASRNATEPSIVLATAETYSLPAGQALSPGTADPNTRTILAAIEGLTNAVSILSAFKPRDDKAAVGVNEAIGLDYRTLFVANSRLGAKLEAEARLDEAAKENDLARQKRKAAAAARSEADDCRRKAVRLLLDVVVKDATRDAAAEPLVVLCLDMDDRPSLEAARKAIDAVDKPPPMGAMLLAVGDLTGPADRTGANFARKVDEAARRLDALLAAYPDNNRICQVRAELAIKAGDVQTARKLMEQVLASEPRSSVARLLMARVHMAEDDYVRAERVLYALAAEFPNFIQAHYYYALAADKTGKTQIARDQMRAATRIDPGGSREAAEHRAGAHKYFAEDLLATFPDRAFDDASEAWRIDPNDPEALWLLVESANRSDRAELARKTLQDTLNRPAIRPNMLLAVAEGYLAIGQADKAAQALQRAADCRPENYADRLAVAQALVRINRGSQADKLLNDAILEDPQSPQAHYVMAMRYDATGRTLQAREHYRKAVEFSSRWPAYRLALANSLVKTGEFDEALAVLKPVLASSSLARQRDLRVRILQGLAPELDAAWADQGQPDSGLPLAMACLQSGQVQKCVDICQAALEKDPASFEYRTLLARALLLLGRPDDSVKLYGRLIAEQPAQLPLYQFLALAMSRQVGPQARPEELSERISALPSVRPDLANAAIADLCRQSGRHAEAAAFYGKVAHDPNCDDALRHRATLFQVNSLANANQPDQALAVLDKLLADGIEVKTTLANKISLLSAMKRLPQAEAAADELFRIARTDRDMATLRRLAGNFIALGSEKKAMEACDAILALDPNESGAHTLRANVLTQFGKLDQAGQAYAKAIELNPTQLNNYVNLANNLDARQMPVEAINVLSKLDGLGQAAKLVALYTEASLLARRGLRNQAASRLKAVGEAEIRSASPAMLLELARAMAALDPNSAKAILVRIPPRCPQYVPAGQMLADLTQKMEEKLAILRALADKNPGNDTLLAHQMKVLMDGARPAEALRAFETSLASGQAKGQLPITSATRALAAAIAAGNLPAAMRTAKMLADSTGPDHWRLLAAALAVDCDAGQVSALLPGRDQANPDQTMLGLCLAVKTRNAGAAGLWLQRLDKIGFAGANAVGSEREDQYRTLCSVLAGDDSRVKSACDKLTARRELLSRCAKELAEHYLAASADPESKLKAVAEANKILRAEIARSLLPDLARLWWMDVLTARPTCLWAAAGLMETADTPARLDEVAALLQPPDCYLAKLLRARILAARGQYDQAARAYESLMGIEKPTADMLFELAGLEERAGNLQKALTRYEQALQAETQEARADTQDLRPTIANNIAYVMSRLFPKDPEKLAKARQFAEEAMKGSTSLAFRDTAGWIAYLQSQAEDAGRKGRIDEACRLLRQAIKALPELAEVHYHLGMAEEAAKNHKLARMHLAQAVAIADKLRADKPNFKSVETEAGDLARSAMLDIPPD